MRKPCRLVAASTSSASAVDALNDLVLLELLARHATDTGAVEVGLLGLNAAKTAELLVALFLPLGDEVSVGVGVFEEPVVELFADGGFFVVEVVDVAGA